MTWTELILVNVNVWDQLILELCTLGINPKNKFNASYISVWSSLVTYHSHNTYSLPNSKARKTLDLLYWRFYNNVNNGTLLQLYLSLVRPHLKYASPVWNPYKQKHVVERVELQMATES